MLAPGLGKGFIRALHNALRAYIDPAARCHLAIHHQTGLIQFVKMIPIRPVWHQIGIGDQNARRICMRLKNPNRFPRLHKQGLVCIQIFQLLYDLVKIRPCPRCPANTAIHHQLMRIFGHIGVQIIHQHPQRRLAEP